MTLKILLSQKSHNNFQIIIFLLLFYYLPFDWVFIGKFDWIFSEPHFFSRCLLVAPIYFLFSLSLLFHNSIFIFDWTNRLDTIVSLIEFFFVLFFSRHCTHVLTALLGTFRINRSSELVIEYCSVAIASV